MKLQNRWRMNIKALAAGFGIALFTCHPLLADDTEIFFGGASPNASAVHPNVLFILDTSSSMTIRDATNMAGQSVTRLDAMKEALHTILDEVTDANVGLMRFTNPGGPVLFPIAYIDEDACNVVGCAPSIETRVSASNDDAEEDASQNVDLTSTSLEMADIPAVITVSFTTDSSNNDIEENDLSFRGGYYESSSDLEFFYDGYAGGTQRIGLRFPSVNIPATATVTGAYLQFTVDESGSGSVSADIYGHAHANSPAFPSDYGSGAGVNARIADAVATKVDWDSIPNPSVNNTVTSPAVTDIVKEIIATPGWSDGEPMTFMIVADSGMTSNSSNKRIFEAGESSIISRRPTLVITYSLPGTSTVNQTIGLRFADVQIPQGVTITSAVIGFEAAGVDSGAATLAIDIEASDDAVSFSDTAPDRVSDRTPSGAPVSWVPAAWTTPGANEQSPSIASLVQTVVSRAGWCGGNAMAMIISGTGTRTAKSYDQTSGGAPVLKVTYDPDTIPSGGGCMRKSIVKKVAMGTDDAEQNTSNNTVNTDSSDLEMMKDSADQFIGLRFQNLPIAQGATIINAYLQFTSKDSGSAGAISMNVYGEATDDATGFSALTDNIGSRALTSAVDWESSAQISEGEIITTATDPADANNLKSVVQAIVDRAGWASGNDMAFVIKKDSGSGVRRMWSYDNNASAAAKLYVEAQWNAGGGSSAPVTTVRQLLKQTVDNIQYKGGTPIVGSMYEAARYYRGEALEFGNQRGSSSNDRREHTRVSHPATYTGGILNRAGSCTDENLSHIDCRTENISGAPVYTSPITATCQESFIILLSDGEPSVNAAATLVKNMTGDSSCVDAGSGACGPELAKFLRDNDQIADVTLQGKQRVTTHTIGFQIDDGWLGDIAINNGGGSYYTATNAASLVIAFNSILASIANVDASFVAPGATVNAFNRLNHRNEIFFSLFKPAEKYKWAGNLKKYQILNGVIADAKGVAAVNSDTGFFHDEAQSYWSADVDGKNVGLGGAAEQLTQIGRKVYTYTGDYSTIPSGGVTISSGGHDVDENNGNITIADLGAADVTERDEILKWARGVDVKDDNEDGNSDDDRKEMGDPLHSVPEIITYGGTDDAPELVVFVATNEGYLHAIAGDSALTSPRPITSPGHEVFSFVPKDLLPNLAKFYRNESTGSRPYGLDGEITSWVIESNDADHIIEPADGDKVYLYIGMRRGGSKYYAMDVTDLNAPKLMWVFEDDTSSTTDAASELGQTWSRPIKTRIRIDVSGTSTKKDVLIFGGGYDPANDDVGSAGSPPTRTVDSIGRAIYIVDALTGDILWSGGIDNGTVVHDEYFSEMNHSIPSDLRVIDINGDSIADFFYASDTGGQIWRFDIHNGSAKADLVSGGVMADLSSSGTPAANNRRFFYEPDASLVGYGSSQYIALAIGSGWRAHPLDEVVDDRLYMIRDSAIYGAPSGYGISTDGGANYRPIVEGDLYDATANFIGQGDANAATSLASSAGWLIQLENSGEKSLAYSTTFNGQTIFTTYEPTASLQSCTAGLGVGRAYVVNTADATPSRNYYDPTNSSDDELTKEDRTHTFDRGGIPPSVVILFPEGSAPMALAGPEELEIDSDRKVDRLYWLEREME